MNFYLNKTIKTYLLFMGVLTFASIVLSPDFRGDTFHELLKNGVSLFILRFSIFSIFAYLFATLFTLQSYERQNVSVAVSMSGKNSFSIITPMLYFALFLSALAITINSCFLGYAIKQLRRDTPLTSHKNLKVYPCTKGTIFFSKDFENFTLITHEKDIYFSPKAVQYSDHFLLTSMNHYLLNDGSYGKIESQENFQLFMNTSSIKPFSKIMLSSNLFSLISCYLDSGQKTIVNYSTLIMTIAYRTIFPLLHIFSVTLASTFAFSRYFRKKYFNALALCIFLSLFAFYLLECTAILAFGGIVSPAIFFIFTAVFLIIPPYITYAKKV